MRYTCKVCKWSRTFDYFSAEASAEILSHDRTH